MLGEPWTAPEIGVLGIPGDDADIRQIAGARPKTVRLRVTARSVEAEVPPARLAHQKIAFQRRHRTQADIGLAPCQIGDLEARYDLQ